MTTPLFALVLLAALLHAGWNALLKIGLDRFLTASLIQIGAGSAALLALPFVAVPPAAAWPWIALSALLHIGYNTFLARAYRYGDLGQVYPLSRGSAPLLVSAVAFFALGEALSPPALLGLGLLVTGLALMALLGARRGTPPSLALLACAFTTGTFIAGYTLADALGARASGDAVAYALWLFAVNGAVAALVLRLTRGAQAFVGLGPHWRAGLAGGVMSMLAYSLVIVATTQAPIGLVSALRETSVLFALLIGVFWLRESLPLGRVCAGLAIVAGVVAIKLA
ncbi:EamA family transporter [uncultured Pseudomonas sp.]|uniref:EamA family transporter n=1 Tax=uncultured Pseudomonas sp. TaxID=114707 RepID=UPI0025E321F4|nr:EamA family transporter [uncultured Pseudomonas sp.]